jgi:hypothetical protein
MSVSIRSQEVDLRRKLGRRVKLQMGGIIKPLEEKNLVAEQGLGVDARISMSGSKSVGKNLGVVGALEAGERVYWRLLKSAGRDSVGEEDWEALEASEAGSVLVSALKEAGKDLGALVVDARVCVSAWKSVEKNLAAEEVSAGDSVNLLVSALRNGEKSSVDGEASAVVSENLPANVSKNEERSLGIGGDSKANFKRLLDKILAAVAMATKLVGVRGGSTERIIERRLLRREKRSARMSIERKDEKRVAVGGFLEQCWISISGA